MHTEIIAEIGLNHNGNPSICKNLIEEAKLAGADYVKFQMRQPSLYRNINYNNEDLGAQYVIDLIKQYNLPNITMFEMFDYAKKIGITPLCTPFDLDSVNLLSEYGMQTYKIASCDLTNIPLLEKIVKLGKRVICSTGMSTENDIIIACNILKNTVYNLLHCNSTYPTPFEDVNLRYMKRLEEISGRKVGYSGHERGIEIPIAAVALGAIIIEKHISITPHADGNDHKVSLSPLEFKQMVNAIRNVENSMGSDSARIVSTGEKINKSALGKSVITNVNIDIGDIITPDKIEIKSPGGGLAPNKIHLLYGRTATRKILANHFLYESDLIDNHQLKTVFKFKHRWGFPVRFHDYKYLTTISNPDFIEFHLTYGDLDYDTDKVDSINNITVHAPDMFENSKLLDLASPDPKNRLTSMRCLDRTCKIATKLHNNSSNTRTFLIVSSGCVMKDGWINEEEKYQYYDYVGEALQNFHQYNNLEIIMQTLPPFPWYFGGQYHINIFTEPKGIIYFCQKYNCRICLDTSHTQLTCNHYGLDFTQVINQLKPYVAHMHLSDAQGISGEGSQIGDGNVDFETISTINASFIPEIWRGHEDNYTKMWLGLTKLERWM